MIRYMIFKYYSRPVEEVDESDCYDYIILCMLDKDDNTGFYSIEKDPFGMYYIGRKFDDKSELQTKILHSWLISLVKKPNIYAGCYKNQFFAETRDIKNIMKEFNELPRCIDNLS